MVSNNQLSQLDPKIKEAYDRVMNTTVPTPNPTPQANHPATEETKPITPPVPSNTNVTKLSPTPVQPAPATPIPQPVPNGSTRREPERIHIGGTVTQKKQSSVSPIIYIICGLIFLLIYTIFWLKFFNVPIPFL